MKKETYYFPHDYDASSDPRILCMLSTAGAVSYGVYWILIEMLYRDSEHRLLNDESTRLAVAVALCGRIPTKEETHLIAESISTMLKYELLTLEEIVGGRTYLRSLSVDRRIQDREKRSEKARDSANVRWEMQTHNNTTQSHSGRMMRTNAIKERKGKEIKEKKEALVANATKKVAGLLQQVITTDQIVEWYEAFKKMRKQKRAPYTIEAELLTLEELVKLTPDQRVVALKTCVSKAWQGIEWGIKAIPNTVNPSKQRGTGAVDYLRAQDGTA